MHLLLEQDTDDTEWQSAPRSSEYIGTASEYSVFTQAELDAVVNALKRESVVVLFVRRNAANDLAAIQTVVSKCIEVDEKLRIWCHYGGDIDFRTLPAEWEQYSHLTDEHTNPKEAIKSVLQKQKIPFPIPFSTNFPLKWENKVSGAKKGMKRKEWGNVHYFLDQALMIAEKERAKFDAMEHMCEALRWRIVVSEIKNKLDEIPDGSTSADWEELSRLAVSAGVGDHRPLYEDYDEDKDKNVPPIRVMEEMYKKLTCTLHRVLEDIEHARTGSKRLSADHRKLSAEECIRRFESAHSRLRDELATLT